MTSNMGMAYAMAYPFGICGILLSMWLIRLFFKIKVDEEAANFEKESGHDKEALKSMSLKVTNTNLNGIHLIEIPGFDDEDVVCSRLKRGELVIVPKADTDVQIGDILHLVGNPEGLKKMHLIIGEEVDIPVASLSGEIRSERVVVTNEKVLGKTNSSSWYSYKNMV